MKLEKAIDDYLLWMLAQGYAQVTWQVHAGVLKHFLTYVHRENIPWDKIFTFATEQGFDKATGLTIFRAAVRGLARYLYHQHRIARPIEKPAKPLPLLYEQYLQHYRDSRQIQVGQRHNIQRTLLALSNHLSANNITIKQIKIEVIDAFLAKRCQGWALVTRQQEVSKVRGFLGYLYGRKQIRKNLAPLLVSAPIFAQAQPPRFLRPEELIKLFAACDLQSAKGLRTHAMLHLAYTLGLRPIEISLITLDDLSFSAAELCLRNRKNTQPIRLPLGEHTLKAIAAYVVGSRPQSGQRTLLLQTRAPYGAVSAATVSADITACMRQAKLNGSAYGLRHTYAQNLLEQGMSIVEIKNMMGHDSIQTTKRYLHIHIKLMRETLFDETL